MMLVLSQLRGKLSKRGVKFSDRRFLLYKGKLAFAKSGSSKAPANDVVPTGPWGPQIPMINQLFQGAQQLYQGGPPQYYPGSTVAPTPELIGQTQNAAVGQVNANIPVNNAAMGTAAGAVGSAYANPALQAGMAAQPNFQQALTSLLNGGFATPLNQTGQALAPVIQNTLSTAGAAQPQYQTPGANVGNLDINQQLQQSLNGTAMSPYLDQVIQGALRSSTNAFNRNVLPGIGDEASAAGQVGGTRQGIAQGIAAGDLANSQTDMVSQIYQRAFDQAAQDRTNALGIISSAQGQNAQLGLATNQLNEALRSALAGEGLQAAGLGANILGQGAQLGQQGAQAGGSLASSLLTSGTGLGTDQLVRSASLLPLLQGANLNQLGFANEMGLQQYGFDQAARDADVERYFFNQFAPYNALTQYQNYISGPYGSSIAGAPNQITDQYTGQLIARLTGGKTPYVQNSLLGNGKLPSPGDGRAWDADPVTGLPSPWKWF